MKYRYICHGKLIPQKNADGKTVMERHGSTKIADLINHADLIT